MNDKDIASSVMDHFDPACYGLRCVLALCYIWAEHLALLEQGGYDQVASPVVNEACASGTL